MVMHARKPQRVSDGYFEKHQAHPYQNSKYNSSKGSYGSSGERYERIRDSPNGNSYRSDSPDSQSPRDRDRAYQSKSSYLQKIREKERENRDYKMSRDKYSDCVRSPKDKRSRDIRDSEHRTNHDRSTDDKLLLKMTSQNSSSRDRKPMHNCQDKQRDDRIERLTRVGDWSEHISSSGKKYYYNCKTEVSQWEKPREWIEREQRDARDARDSRDQRDTVRGGGGGGERDRPRNKDHRTSSGSGGSGSSSATASCGGVSELVGGDSGSGGRMISGGYSGGSRTSTISHEKHSNSSRGLKRHWRDDSDIGGHHDPRRKHSNAGIGDGDIQSTQDMDISPGDSTPTSEISYVHTPSTSSRGDQASLAAVTNTPTIGDDPPITTPILLSTVLPRLQQQPPPNQQQSHNTPQQQQQSTVLSPEHAPTAGHTPSMVPPPVAGVISCNTPGPPQQSVTLAGRILSQMSDGNGETANGEKMNVGVGMGDGVVGDGSATPTHSETHDCIDPRKSLVSSIPTSTIPPLSITSPPGTLSCLSATTSLSTTTSTLAAAVAAGSAPPTTAPTTPTLSSLQHVASCTTSSLSALRPQGPSITPSLANYYRDDLVNHVRGWPADILEKQAQKLSEEAHVMGSLQCTKVSAELKSARSIVRLTEIQATLQEQRILFLRQQIKTLEDMKAQNSFMSDDS